MFPHEAQLRRITAAVMPTAPEITSAPPNRAATRLRFPGGVYLEVQNPIIEFIGFIGFTGFIGLYGVL